MRKNRIIHCGAVAVGFALLLVAGSSMVFGQDRSADLSSGREVVNSGEDAGSSEAPPPSVAIVASVEDSNLRLLLAEVLARNPEVAALAADARAAAQRAPQVKAKPDPVASIGVFVLTPETRVGPQYGGLGLSQKFPWFGKLPLRERAAVAAAAAAETRVETQRLKMVTEARRFAYELAFLAAEEREVQADRAALEHYEELARARYASGVGIGQGVIKIQAEITRDDTRLLEIETRRAALAARINILRDRADGSPVPAFDLPVISEPALDSAVLREQALAHRPELFEADALIIRAERLAELAEKSHSPDVTAGINYTFVGKRRDQAGIDFPPENNSRDVLGLYAAVNLPVRRKKLDAGVEEAVQRKIAAEERRRAVVAGIEGALDDLTSRLDLTWGRIRLFEDALIRQAAESLRSAESAYAAGTYNALDLLDAERVLLGVRVATERARTDFAVATAELEGVVGAPLASLHKEKIQ